MGGRGLFWESVLYPVFCGLASFSFAFSLSCGVSLFFDPVRSLAVFSLRLVADLFGLSPCLYAIDLIEISILLWYLSWR
ncbi:unnamed protein product [Arabidopsis halleri]